MLQLYVLLGSEVQSVWCI